MHPQHPFPEVDSALFDRLTRITAQAAAEANRTTDDTERLAYVRLREIASENASFRYVLEEEIARGGMGVVYRVSDTDLRRSLAMKVVLGRIDGRIDAKNPHDSVLLMRFLEEARVMGQLDHPGIVPLHELGIDSTGCVYFTMRLVRGRHLGEAADLARRGEEGWNLTGLIEALVKVCDAVAYAHSKGVVHRDLKPANVMVGRFGEVYVMDWGVAKVLHRSASPPVTSSGPALTLVSTGPSEARGGGTMAGTVFGTPAHMSPEQARGEVDRVDAQSDVYSVGSILYQLLAGHPPYLPLGTQVSSSTVLRWVIEGPPKPLTALDRNLPRELVAVCEKAMSRVPNDRYTDLRTMAEDLRAWLGGRPVAAYPMTPVARAARWCRRNPWVAAVLFAVTLSSAIGLRRLVTMGQRLMQDAAVADAATKARMLETVNGLYSSMVVSRVKDRIQVTHDWRDHPGAIPLPATFLTELADKISEDGHTAVKHYSDYPFLFRGPPNLDDFGRRALASLRAHPDTPVKEFETIEGQPVLRYAAARRMEESCVGCHNTHPESSRKDWMVGDVRGVLEIAQPLDAEAQRSREVRGTLATVVALVVGLTALCAVALVRGVRAERAR